MCGIAGFVGKGTAIDLSQMISTLKHRGPDYQGFELIGETGFAHARLSIIDLSADGNQPFYNADKSVGIVFNGEIYNYLELKEQLLRLGKYAFRSTSDTEVLLYLYEEYGENMFEKLNGMFAFAIYDYRAKKLMLARDRMGKKPLYYGIFNGTLVFGSEIKAVLKHPSVSKEINPDALNEYLTFEYVPTPHSIFKNIYKLEASHYLIFENGRITGKKPYWKINFNRFKGSLHEGIQQFDELLSDSVKLRLVADVPLGVFLSGGLDSSTIAYYAQKNSNTKIKTYSIGFSEKSYDESDYAALVAKHLDTDHHLQVLSATETLKLIPFLFEKLDEPFADPSIIPTYYLSKFTRSEVTVALGGDGSDELLAGYPTFISHYFSGFYAVFPGLLKSLVRRMAEILPVSDKNISFDFKIKQFLRGFESENRYITTLWLGSFLPGEKQQLLSKETRALISNGNGLNAVDRYLAELPDGLDGFLKMQYIYYRTYLLEDILVKVDRASMFSSLEVRAPFLDYRLVEFLTNLPESYKIKNFNGKYILKQLMRNKIPDAIIDRPKKGFGIPLSYWLRHDLKATCNELLSEAALSKHNLFDVKYVQKIKQDHFDLKHNNRKLLWNLMMFQGWYMNYMV